MAIIWTRIWPGAPPEKLMTTRTRSHPEQPKLVREGVTSEERAVSLKDKS